MIKKITRWIANNKSEFILLLIILLIGAISRLYRIGEYMTFLGDEGRDAIIVRRLLVDFDPILIGPGTSIGNMYLGPLYYYLMAPFLLIFNFSPVGPSVMVALLGIATIFLIWYASRLWFGRSAALVSSMLYAVSPVVIIYNRSSWNPNIMPFFALLTIFSLWKIWIEGKTKWFVVLGISLAFVLQSHYLGLLLLPTIFLFLFLKYREVLKKPLTEKVLLLRNGFWGLLIFLFLMSPLLIFDIRHNFINFNAVKEFFTKRETTVSIKPWKAIPNIYPILRDNISTRIVAGQNVFAGKITLYALLIGFTFFIGNLLFKARNVVFNEGKINSVMKAYFLVSVWMAVGLVGMGLYKQHVYDHYFGYLFPAAFLMIGGIYQKVMDMHFDGLKIIASAWIIILFFSCVVNSPLRGSPNFQMKRAIEVADQIKKDAGSSKFNLAVIAEQNYEDGYQYFLEKDNANVVDIDALRLNETIGEYLYVVCEMAEEKCDPTHSPKAEVANFGWSRVESKMGVSGVTVYKLAHVN